MLFPGLSRFSVPLLGAGQQVALTGPPPDSFRRVPETEGKGPGGGIRVRVLTNAAGTAPPPRSRPVGYGCRRAASGGVAARVANSAPPSPVGLRPVTTSSARPGGLFTPASLRACRIRPRANVASALAIGAQRSSSRHPESTSSPAIAATTSVTRQRFCG